LPKVTDLSLASAVKINRAIGDEFQVNTYTTNNQDDPKVVGLSNGNFVVVFYSYNNGVKIYGQLYDANSNKLSAEFQITDADEGHAPAVAALENGRFIVTYASGDGNSIGVFGRLYDANANPEGSKFLINTATGDEQDSATVAALSDGKFMVVWSSYDSDWSNSYGNRAQLYNATGSLIGSELQINPSGTFVQIAALQSSNNFIIVWRQYNGSIHGRLYNATTNPITNSFQISAVSASSRGLSLAALGNGGFLVTWHANGISARLYDTSANQIGNEFLVSSEVSGDPRPSASGNSNGFITTWTVSDISDDIYAQIFTNNGTRIGTEFLVNSYTLSSQEFSSVANLNNENFVVTWQSNQQDGSGHGIYSKIIDTHLKVSMSNQTLHYQENLPQKLAEITITPPVFISQVTATLTLSEPLAGTLSTNTSGLVTSTYDINTGIWQASGNVTDVNNLLAGLTFQPLADFSGNFSIAVAIQDGLNTVNRTIQAIGSRMPTTQPITTVNPASSMPTALMPTVAVTETPKEPSARDATVETGLIAGLAAGAGGVAVGLTAFGIWACKRQQKACFRPDAAQDSITELGIQSPESVNHRIG